MARQKVLLRAGWRYAKTIGGADDIRYHNPWDLALRPDGVMAVLCRQQLDHAKIVINTFDDEEYLGEFGEVGTDVGQLARPTCLAFGRDGLLYVADEQTNRVNSFTIDPKEVAANGGQRLPFIINQQFVAVRFDLDQRSQASDFRFDPLDASVETLQKRLRSP